MTLKILSIAALIGALSVCQASAQCFGCPPGMAEDGNHLDPSPTVDSKPAVDPKNPAVDSKPAFDHKKFNIPHFDPSDDKAR